MTHVKNVKKMNAMANNHKPHTSPRCVVAQARRTFLDMHRLAEQHADNPVLGPKFAELRDIAVTLKGLVESSTTVAPIDPEARYGLAFEEYVEVGREVKGYDYTTLYSMAELGEMYDLPHDILCKIIAEFY